MYLEKNPPNLSLIEQYIRTDKKENKIFLIYKEILNRAVTKWYMRKGFLIYEEMRKYLPICKEAVSNIWLYKCSIMNFLIYEENLIFFFISAGTFFGMYLKRNY